MCLSHTDLVLGFLAKGLLALKLLLGRDVHRPEAFYLRQVLLQCVVWVYGLVCGSSITSGIVQDRLLASWVLLQAIR